MRPQRRDGRAQKRRLRLLVLVLGFVLGALALAALGRWAGPLLKPRLEAELSRVTGLDASVDSLDLSLLAAGLRFEGLVLRDEGGERLHLAAGELVLDRSLLLRGRLEATQLKLSGLRLDLSRPWPALPPSEGPPASAAPLDILSLRVEDARVLLPGPVPELTVQARGGLLGSQLRIEEMEIDAGPVGRAVVGGLVRLFGVEEPELDLELDYEAQAEGLLGVLAPDSALLAKGPVAARLAISGPSSALEIEGVMSLAELEVEPGMRLVGLSSSPQVHLSASGWRLESDLSLERASVIVEGLDGPLELSGLEGRVGADSTGRARASLRAALGGGQLRIEAGASSELHELRLLLEGAELESLPRPLGSPPLAGLLRLEWTARSAPGAGLEQAEHEILASLEPPPEEVPGALSASSNLSARFEDGVLVLEPSELALMGLRLAAEGRLPLEGEAFFSLTLRADSLERVSRALAPFVPALVEPSRRLEGALSFEGLLEGTKDALRLSGPLEVSGLKVDSREAGRLSATLALDSQAMSLQDLRLESDWGRAEGRARVPLAEPSLVEAELSLEGLDLEVLAALAGTDLEIAGSASGTLNVGEAGAALVLVADALRVEGLIFDRAELEAVLAEDLLTLTRFEASSSSAELRAEGLLPLEPGREGRLAFSVENLLWQRELAGEPFRVLFDGRGELHGRFVERQASGEGSFSLREASWGEDTLPDQAGRFVLDEAGLKLSLEGGLAAGRASWDFHGSGELTVELALPALDLTPFLPEGIDSLEVGASRLHGGGTLSQPRLELEVESAKALVQGVLVETESALRLSLADGRLDLPASRVLVAGRPVEIEASLETEGDRELQASLRGELELGALLEASTGAAAAAGNASLDLRVRGTPGELLLGGTAEISGLAWRGEAMPAALEGGRARLRLEAGRIVLESFEASLGGGRLEGGGEIEWTGSALGRHRFRLSGRDVHLREPEVFSGRGSFEVELAGGLEATTLSGELRLETALYVQDLHLERSLASSGRARPTARRAGPLDHVQLDLRLRSVEDLIVRNDLATAELTADLDVRGTAARPLLVGLAEARPGGTVRFQRVSYRLLDGIVAFGPRHVNDPELEALAEARVGDYLVTLEIGGRLSDPRIELSSSPELPRERLVALLLSGGLLGAPGGGPPSSVAEVAPGLAQDYLGGRLDPLERRARQALRLDVVELDPVLVGGADARGARLTVGKALSERLFLTQSVLFGGAGDATTELRLKLSERLSLRQVHEWDGSNSVEARWSRSFGPASKATDRASATELGGPMVGTLLVLGAPEVPGEQAMQEALALTPPSPATETALRRAAERARSRLVEARHFLARATCTAEESEESERTVTCELTPGPRLELELEGAGDKKERKAIRRAVEERWSELLRGEDPALSAREAALEALAMSGHLHATASASASASVAPAPASATAASAPASASGGANVELEDRQPDAPQSRRVALSVQPGPVVRLGKILVEGASALPASASRKVARSAAGGPFRSPRLRPSLPGEALRAIEDLYLGAGHLDVRVQAILRAPEGGERGDLEVVIEEGALFRLHELRFEGELPSPEKAWLEKAARAAGEPVDAAALDALADEIVGAHDGAGRPDATVSWIVLRREDGTADAILSVVAGPTVRFGASTFVGLVRTDEDFARRTLDLEEGAPFSRQAMLEARRRLRATGLFSSVVVRAAEVDEDGANETRGEAAASSESVRPIQVRVAERDHVELTLGAGWDEEDGPIATTSLSNRNLDGRARSTALHLRLSTETTQAEGRLGWPRLFGTKWSLLETLRARRDVEESVSFDRVGLRSGLSRPFGRRLRLDLHHLVDRLDQREVELGESDERLDEGLLSEVGIGLARDGRDDAARPRRGSLSSIQLRVAPSWLGSELEQLVVEAQHAWWLPVSKRGLVLAGALQIGAGWPLGGAERLALVERFRVGGVGTVRGYRPGHAGPLDPATGDPLGGDARLVLRNELRVPVGARWSAILFADAGRGFASVDELSSFDLFWSLGAGFGIDTPAGPLRLLYGFAMNAEPGEPSGRLHFTFGSAF